MPTAKHCEIMCDVDKMPVDIQATIQKYKTIKKWAYIIHDKDDTRAHYHIYLNFGQSSVDFEMVARWFQIPSNFVEKIKGRAVDMLLYLTHGQESQRHKYQYDPSEVIANYSFEKEIEESKIIGDFKNYSYAQQLAYVNSLDKSDKATAFNKLKKLWEIECQCSSLLTNRDLQVVFITGKAGTGKTFYAKKIFEKLGYDYCVSSSSNDPFQDYLGQKGMILDDLRDNSFSLNDLLKIIDNNTSSSIKSRFANKVFNGLMIIITSSVPLPYWYKEFRYSSVDTLDQLYRRINTYIFCENEYVEIYDEGVGEDGKPKGHPKFIINEVKDLKKEKKEKIEISSLFDIF